MANILIHKQELLPQFMSGNIASFGAAAGKLKLCGLKLYTYLMCNANGFDWNIYAGAYAHWLGVANSRGVRKAIDDGIQDLLRNGFMNQISDEKYEFSEQFVPEWQKNYVEQTVPKTEQIVPKVELTVPEVIKTFNF